MKINYKGVNARGPRRGTGLAHCGMAAVSCFDVLTAGLFTAVERHACESGRLQWLPSVPGVMAALEFYAMPARFLAKMPAPGAMFETRAYFWWAITDPPETTD